MDPIEQERIRQDLNFVMGLFMMSPQHTATKLLIESLIRDNNENGNNRSMTVHANAIGTFPRCISSALGILSASIEAIHFDSIRLPSRNFWEKFLIFPFRLSPHLKSVRFSNCDLNDTNTMDNLGRCLENMQHLPTLIFENCDFGEDLMSRRSRMGSGLQGNHTLTHFELSGEINPRAEQLLLSVPQRDGCLLKKFVLSNPSSLNHRIADASVWIRACANCKSLESLELSHAKIQVRHLKRLFSAISKNHNLKTVVIRIDDADPHFDCLKHVSCIFKHPSLRSLVLLPIADFPPICQTANNMSTFAHAVHQHVTDLGDAQPIPLNLWPFVLTTLVIKKDLLYEVIRKHWREFAL